MLRNFMRGKEMVEVACNATEGGGPVLVEVGTLWG